MHSKRRVLIVLTFVASAFGANAFAGDTEASLTPRQQAVSYRLEALEAARRASPDLRLRILNSRVIEFIDERRPDLGIRTRALIEAGTLFEQARGSTDPLLLDLLLQRCALVVSSPSPCDRLEVARRWVTADTQNQLAWLSLSMVQKQQGAHEDSRASFLRASQASQWHDHHVALARLLADTIPQRFPLRERNAALVQSLGRAGANLPFAQMQLLGTYCKESDAMRDACLRIVATLARDTDDLMGLSLAARYAARAGADPSTVDAYQQRADAAWWALSLDQTKGSWSDDMEVDDDTSRRLATRLEAMIALGEPRLAERIMLERNLREADAAKSFVATLPASVLALRDAARHSP